MRVTLLVWVAAALASAQEDRPIFRAGVSLVHVDAEAVGPDGRILEGLEKGDFRILDNGKEQPIVNFSAGEEPLDLILLFDISGSMSFVVEKVAAAAHEAFQELRAGDRVSVMVFNTRSRVVSPFTEDLAEVERTIREEVLGQKFGGGTMIQAAVDDAAMRFLHEKRTTRRRAVLIVTDNVGVRTRREETVVRDFWEADALLSGLIVRNTVQTAMLIASPTMLAIQAGMKGIAAKTGGDAIHAGDPGSAFRDAMHRIRSRYSLYYEPPDSKPGATRSIRVELAPDAAQRFPKTRVRARTGYVVPAKGRAPAVN
jgi:VWFA-related protein